METAERPLGYWIKSLDGLIETTFERALAGHGILRRHWQVMNALLRGDPPEQALAPFWNDEAITLDATLGDLHAKGWLDDANALTGQGRAAFARVAAEVSVVRARVTAGLTDAEYQATVRTLRRMVENLAT
jgi:hypothetical protein